MEEYPFLAQAISDVVETIRQEKQISKSALADFARLQRCYLREIELGTKKPTVNVIYCICEALGIKPAKFFRLVDARIETLKAE